MSCISIQSQGGFEEASSDVLVLERHRFCWLSFRFSCLVIGDKCGQVARLAMVTGAQQGGKESREESGTGAGQSSGASRVSSHFVFFFSFFAER